MTTEAAPARCPDCGKVRYSSKSFAKRVIRRMKGRDGRLNAYRCGDFWHVGHLPTAVKQGRLARANIAPRDGSA